MAHTGATSDPLEQAASQADLGELQTTFQPYHVSWVSFLLRMTVPVGLLCLMLWFFAYFEMFFPFGPVVGVVLVGAVGWSLISFWLANKGFRENQELRFHIDGVVVRAERGRVLAYRWEDTRLLVKATEHGPGGPVTYSHALLHRFNPPLIIGQDTNFIAVVTNTLDQKDLDPPITAGPFQNEAEVRRALQEEATRVHLPRTLAELDAGRPVEFGSATVSPQALTLDGKEIPWSEISALSIKRGFLHIKRAGKFFKTSLQLSYIPDFSVFAAVVRHYSGAPLE